MKELYKDDIDFLMSKQGHLGGQLWTTEDFRIGKGSPFSARDIAIILPDLGFSKEDHVVRGLAEMFFENNLQESGKFRFAPKSAIYPCHTITAARALCLMGYAKDPRLEKTFEHILDIQHEDGGWRCNKVKYGKGGPADMSNPGTTLEALDVIRHFDFLDIGENVNKAVEFLLGHWEIKKPLGPCQFGIGSLFMQTEFPFLRYNLFFYCHTLSFYRYARNDRRFIEAFEELKSKLIGGQMIVENPNRRLAKLSFCKKGQPSLAATTKYREIPENLKILD